MKRIVLLLAFALIYFNSYSQSGLEGFNYQTIVRDNAGVPIVNKAINFRFSLLDAGPNGAVQYAETKLITTNTTGLVNHVVGKGNPTMGLFANIPFQNANQYLKVEADIAGGNNFQPIGSIALMSVPFAQFAAKGNVGPKGDTGAQGPQGIQGIQGNQGPQGPAGAGIVTVLGYNPPSNVFASLASMTPTMPLSCRTAPYTAGPGETAIINTSGSLYPNNSVTALLLINAGAIINGAPFTSISNQSLESMSDGAATAGVNLVYPLTANSTYIFGTIFESNALSSINLIKASCGCTVTIVKQ
ncbi:MAG: hypothetical protein ACKOW2_00510 [Sphingobacteriaceae bacterium]